MTESDELVQAFVAEVDCIAERFIRCFGLKFEKETAQPTSSLHRWLDFVFRHIEPAWREPEFSAGFWKRMPKNVVTTVDLAVHLLCNNGDINPYQSKGLLGNDESGERRGRRTDLLWADWGIHHFHLTDDDIASGEYFAGRSNWLLFALVFKDTVLCIDVRHHPKGVGFSDEELLTIAIRNWPRIFENWKLKDAVGLERTEPYSKKDIHDLRSCGVSALHGVDGAVYAPPGGGITTASTSTLVSGAANHILSKVKARAAFFADRGREPFARCREAGVEEPDWRLCLTPKGLAVYEKTLDMAWLMAESGPDPNWVEILAPKWAVARLVAAKA